MQRGEILGLAARTIQAVVDPTWPSRHRGYEAAHRSKSAGPRGKRVVVLVGQKKAVAIAVRNVSDRRWSKLSEWLSSKSSVIPNHERVGQCNTRERAHLNHRHHQSR